MRKPIRRIILAALAWLLVTRAAGAALLIDSGTPPTPIGGLTIYAGGAMRDANVGVGTLFQSAAVGLLICGVLMLMVKPTKAAA